MSSFDWNKLFGAVLATVLVMLGVGKIADVVISESDAHETTAHMADAKNIKKYAYTPPMEEKVEAKAAEVVEVVPIQTLLVAANLEESIASGEKVAKKCKACHTFDLGGANKVGPNLWNIINASIAANGDFAYSDAMEAKADQAWDYENMNSFLLSPKGYIKGTKMSFKGLSKDQDRTNIILYLRSLSDNPAEL